MSLKPSRYALSQSKARIFVGQLEPYVTEQDLFPVFSAYGKILHLNVVRHSTTVTPNEERRIPTAFVWYETTSEADAAIASLHNIFTFSSPDEDESKKRYIQVSYADKTPECTSWGQWQKRQAEITRRSAPQSTATTGAALSASNTATAAAVASVAAGASVTHTTHSGNGANAMSSASPRAHPSGQNNNNMLTLNDGSTYGNSINSNYNHHTTTTTNNNNNTMGHMSPVRNTYANYGNHTASVTSHHKQQALLYHPHAQPQTQLQPQPQPYGSLSYGNTHVEHVSHLFSGTSSYPSASHSGGSRGYPAETLTARVRPTQSHRPLLPHSHSVPVFTHVDTSVVPMSSNNNNNNNTNTNNNNDTNAAAAARVSQGSGGTPIINVYGHSAAMTCHGAVAAHASMPCYYDSSSYSGSPMDWRGMTGVTNTNNTHYDGSNNNNGSSSSSSAAAAAGGYLLDTNVRSPNVFVGPLSYPHTLTRHGSSQVNRAAPPPPPKHYGSRSNRLGGSFALSSSSVVPSVASGRSGAAGHAFTTSRVDTFAAAPDSSVYSRHTSCADLSAVSTGEVGRE